MHPTRPGLALRLALATATLAGALTTIGRADDCPTSTLTIPTLPPEEVAGPTASGTRLAIPLGSASFYFRGYGDSVSFTYQGSGAKAEFTVRGRYRFLGPAPGTLVGNLVRVHVDGDLYASGGPGNCPLTWARASLIDVGAHADSATWYSEPLPYPYENCTLSFVGTLSVTCEHPAGTEFDLAQHIQIALTPPSANGELHAGLELGALPPGAFMVRCDGDTSVQLVGVGPGPVSALGIDAIRPNPAQGAFTASMFVPAGGPAIVQLLDVAGRAVETRILDAPSPARRELSFGGALPVGVYFLRARQGALMAVREVVVRR